MKNLWKTWNNINIIMRILIGAVIGTILAILFPNIGAPITILGDVFLNALKAIAPMLVFVLVMSAIANHDDSGKSNVKSVLKLYVVVTLAAVFLAVVASMLFPVYLEFGTTAGDVETTSSISQVLGDLILRIIDNPVKALYDANYLGILTASILLGLYLRNAASTTKTMLIDFEGALSKIVGLVISFAPVGIMGILYGTITTSGLSALVAYTRLLVVIIGTEFVLALVVNPFIVWWHIRKNPYPLVFKCLKDSGITAFFTMSSAANIPVNLNLCEELGLHKDTYSITIPLGATVNMAGSAITLNILALAAAHSLGIEVGFVMAIIVSIVSAISAAGTAGIAGGAVLLVPVACSALGIPDNISMQVLSIGLIITPIQDAFTTALNSSTDALLTATAEFGDRRKNGIEFDI